MASGIDSDAGGAIGPNELNADRASGDPAAGGRDRRLYVLSAGRHVKPVLGAHRLVARRSFAGQTAVYPDQR
jgi:hypothetical protein